MQSDSLLSWTVTTHSNFTQDLLSPEKYPKQLHTIQIIRDLCFKKILTPEFIIVIAALRLSTAVACFTDITLIVDSHAGFFILECKGEMH